MAGAIVVGMCIFLLPPINFAVWDFLLERALSSPPDFIPLITEPLEVFGAYYPVDMELLGVGAAEAFMVLVISLIVVGAQRFPEVAPQGGRYFRMARRYAAEVTADGRGDLEAEVEEQREELRAAQEDISTGIATLIRGDPERYPQHRARDARSVAGRAGRTGRVGERAGHVREPRRASCRGERVAHPS